MEEVQALVFDVDGVLKSGDHALEGASQIIQFLESKSVPYAIITNCPFLDREQKAAELKSLGIQIPSWKILGAADPLGPLLKSFNLKSEIVYSVGVEDPQPFLRQWNLQINNEATSDELGAIILFDDDMNWTLPRLTTLYNLYLENADIPLIIPNPDKVFPHKPGGFMPTSGSIAQWLGLLLEPHGIKLNPIFLGKPHPPLYELAKEIVHQQTKFPIPNASIAMVGDSLGTDLLGASQQGWQTFWMKTGNLAHHYCDLIPDREFQNLNELQKVLEIELH